MRAVRIGNVTTRDPPATPPPRAPAVTYPATTGQACSPRELQPFARTLAP